MQTFVPSTLTPSRLSTGIDRSPSFMQWQRQQQQQEQSNANDQLPSASLQNSCTRQANPQREQQLPTISSSKNSSGSSTGSSNLAPTTNRHQPLFKSFENGTPPPAGVS